MDLSASKFCLVEILVLQKMLNPNNYRSHFVDQLIVEPLSCSIIEHWPLVSRPFDGGQLEPEKKLVRTQQEKKVKQLSRNYF
jgi:hypothetical protein